MFNNKSTKSTRCVSTSCLCAAQLGMLKIKKLHDHMRRLYEAARAAGRLQPEDGQAEMARLLNVSQQRLNNWESRGPSKEALLIAQEVFGVNSTWVQSGEGSMFVGRSEHPTSTSDMRPADLAELITIFQDASDSGRNAILTAARSVQRARSRGKGRAINE